MFGHDQVDLPAPPVAAARIELPRYSSLDGASIAPVFVGAAFTFAVHLVASDGKRLADTTVTVSGAELVPTRWTQFRTPTLASGHHEIRIGADSITPTTLAFDTIYCFQYVDCIEAYPGVSWRHGKVGTEVGTSLREGPGRDRCRSPPAHAALEPHGTAGVSYGRTAPPR